MKRILALLLTLLGAVGIASCDSEPTSTAGRSNAGDVTVLEDGTPSASAVGVARYTFGATTAHLSFIVNNSSTSATTGKALYYTAFADVVMEINVTCLHTSGGTATFLGTVGQSSDPSIEGKDAYWQVVDGSPDQASIVSLADEGTGPSCTAPGEFDLVNISAGTIIVS